MSALKSEMQTNYFEEESWTDNRGTKQSNKEICAAYKNNTPQRYSFLHTQCWGMDIALVRHLRKSVMRSPRLRLQLGLKPQTLEERDICSVSSCERKLGQKPNKNHQSIDTPKVEHDDGEHHWAQHKCMCFQRCRTSMPVHTKEKI